MFLKVETAVQAEEKSKKEFHDMKRELSSLTSQVGQLTSMLGMMRTPIPTKEAREGPIAAMKKTAPECVTEK
jgi:hypothetical protein